MQLEITPEEPDQWSRWNPWNLHFKSFSADWVADYSWNTLAAPHPCIGWLLRWEPWEGLSPVRGSAQDYIHSLGWATHSVPLSWSGALSLPFCQAKGQWQATDHVGHAGEKGLGHLWNSPLEFSHVHANELLKCIPCLPHPLITFEGSLTPDSVHF